MYVMLVFVGIVDMVKGSINGDSSPINSLSEVLSSRFPGPASLSERVEGAQTA